MKTMLLTVARLIAEHVRKARTQTARGFSNVAQLLNPKENPLEWRCVPGDDPSIAVNDTDGEMASRRDTAAIWADSKRRLDECKDRITDDLQVARKRFLAHRRDDPFPKIPAALLNCGQFFDYVAETGMIVPFDLDPKLFKLASYDIKLLGQAVYWDEHGKMHREHITYGKRFVLRANSIAFVTLRPFLQLPDYIALRFNLRITNVYRGLLLGTGPLVDPGFQGRLSIPLHNLTTNDYVFHGGEPLITVEFTKVAGTWGGRPDKSDGSSRLKFTFPEAADTKFSDRNVDAFLKKVGSFHEVRSSIPEATADATKAAQDASRKSDLTVLFAAVTTVLAVAGIVSAVWDSTFFTAESRNDLRERSVQQAAEIRTMQQELTSIRAFIQDSAALRTLPDTAVQPDRIGE